jgi:hypothetical protein
MKRSRGAVALIALLVLNVVLVVLLTPLGFESRPTTALQSVGYVAIACVFIGLVVDVAAIIVLLRRVRAGARLAIIGSIVLFVPNIVDRAGTFFTLPIPPVINVLEYAHIAVLIATLVVAAMVYREAGAS